MGRALHPRKLQSGRRGGKGAETSKTRIADLYTGVGRDAGTGTKSNKSLEVSGRRGEGDGSHATPVVSKLNVNKGQDIKETERELRIIQ